MTTRRMFMAGGIASTAIASIPASAQVGGTPVKIIFPFGAGGGGDALCRYLGEGLSKAINRAVIVENRTGADGRIGIQAGKAAAPDGDTLLVTTGPTMALMPLIHKAPGYDPNADFEPISHLANFEFCLVVANNVGVANVADLVKWAKSNPDKATYAVPGLGTLPHFSGVSFSRLIGVDMRRLAYRGGAPAMNDLVAGQVPIGFMTLSDALQQHKGGLVKIVAVLSKTRSPFLPDAPTLTEVGYAIDATAWYGLWAPAKTPKDIIDKTSAAVGAILKSAAAREKLAALGMIAVGDGPAGLRATQAALVANWSQTIKDSGFTMEK
jgi:tripartite-type tricarboxylate transporter receptor subunit TctC